LEETTTRQILHFFELLTLLEVFLVRLIVFALFCYGTCHLALKVYNFEKHHHSPMSRKFDRRLQIQREALNVMTNPEVMARLFKKKPWWMPKWIWKIVVGFVIVQ